MPEDFDWEEYLAEQEANKIADSGAHKGRMPYIIAVDGDLVTAVRDPLEYNPFGLRANAVLPDKPSPEDLDIAITEREKTGASIYVVKKTETSWYMEFFNNKFYLSSFSMALREKVQILETFGSAVVSFFDESVKVYNFGGVAIDWLSSNVDARYSSYHQSGLIHMYNNVLRGTKLVDKDRIAVMAVANHYIYGYPLNLNVNYSSDNQKVANFQMSWVVMDHSMNYPFYMDEESELENIYKIHVRNDPFGNTAQLEVDQKGSEGTPADTLNPQLPLG